MSQDQVNRRMSMYLTSIVNSGLLSPQQWCECIERAAHKNSWAAKVWLETTLKSMMHPESDEPCAQSKDKYDMNLGRYSKQQILEFLESKISEDDVDEGKNPSTNNDEDDDNVYEDDGDVFDAECVDDRHLDPESNMNDDKKCGAESCIVGTEKQRFIQCFMHFLLLKIRESVQSTRERFNILGHTFFINAELITWNTECPQRCCFSWLCTMFRFSVLVSLGIWTGVHLADFMPYFDCPLCCASDEKIFNSGAIAHMFDWLAAISHSGDLSKGVWQLPTDDPAPEARAESLYKKWISLLRKWVHREASMSTADIAGARIMFRSLFVLLKNKP